MAPPHEFAGNGLNAFGSSHYLTIERDNNDGRTYCSVFPSWEV
ncbi:hypothetical protein PIIN_11430 [Serendipita indica DSM 11827]|uniref:Uncharacterized protein n=1 Tax=Serendipita indica (strain DSM 11827) TaxID=1109443 RepID=G4U1L0_SERID|nr:hypothetical protein PIIN_11430 [Serendipita indica DSM 11827]